MDQLVDVDTSSYLNDLFTVDNVNDGSNDWIGVFISNVEFKQV